jgi:hypothetical protein
VLRTVSRRWSRSSLADGLLPLRARGLPTPDALPDLPSIPALVPVLEDGPMIYRLDLVRQLLMLLVVLLALPALAIGLAIGGGTW